MKKDDYIPLPIKPLEKQHTNFLLPIGFYNQDGFKFNTKSSRLQITCLRFAVPGYKNY